MGVQVLLPENLVEIEAKSDPLKYLFFNESDANPPGGDTKPPGTGQ